MTIREAIATSLAAWGAVYPNLKLGEGTPQAWERLLAGFSPQGVIYAFNRALKESVYPTLPSVAVVREYATAHDRRIRDLVASYTALASRKDDLSEDDRACLRSYQEQLRRLPAGLVKFFATRSQLAQAQVDLHRPALEDA